MKEYTEFNIKMKQVLTEAVKSAYGEDVRIHDYLFDITIENTGMNPGSDWAELTYHDGGHTMYNVDVDLGTGEILKVDKTSNVILGSIF